MRKLATLITAGVFLAAAGIANATMIYGQIKLQPTAGNSANVTLNSAGTAATLIDFINNGSDGIQMMDGTGDFAGVTGTGSISDINLEPFSAINPLWTIGGFSFALNSISVNSVISVPSTTVKLISLAGNGTISGNGYDDTTGAWTLTLDTTGGSFNWSSTVPEPASLALMGLGLLGLGAVGRRRRS